MTLHLSYKGETTVPVEIEGLVPDTTRDKSIGDIERFSIQHGNEKLPLAEFFQVRGDASDQRFELEGDLSGVHWVGTGMADGSIHVAGNVGRHLGSDMTGGEIHVDGDASDWVGGEMHGGLIHVRGRAGHLVGAAYRGSRRGMTGGTILVGGDVGNEAGHTMRRGTLVIGGDAGDLVGFNMIAGSVLIDGNSGIRPGAGMRRGTIGIFGDEPPGLLPTFKRACQYQPPILQLVARWLDELKFAAADSFASIADGFCELYHGDLIEQGRGEILLRAQ